MQQIFSGLPAVPGVGIGALHIYIPLSSWRKQARPSVQGSSAEEWQRFVAARQRVDDELAHLSSLGDKAMSEIFLVHREILHDKTLTDAVRAAIAAGTSALVATQQATAELIRIFQNLSDSYFASRAADIRDVAQRLIAHLDGVSFAQQLGQLPPRTVLVADDLTPFDTAHLSAESVVGIALAGSAPTAHTAILARSLGIAMVCGLGPAILQLRTAQQAVLDGIQGRLFVEPDEETLRSYQQLRGRLQEFRIAAEARTHEPAVTLDGVVVPVRINVNNREDTLLAVADSADGVGLLRTEYLFQQRTTPPSVQEQIEAYHEIASHFPSKPLTVRLLDVGGDKPLQYLPRPAETNPFLGMRGVRLLLQHPQILREQLRALIDLALDSSFTGVVRILVPMVSKTVEVHQVLALLESMPGFNEERRRGRLRIGTMIEVPSAALLSDRLAPLVDFFSIGTNDLSQYTLAADRINSAVAALASSLDPSVLRLIAMTADAGRQYGIPVTVCGELAGDPSVIPLLLGLGISEVSVAAPSVALVKESVRQTDVQQARHLAKQALQCNRAQEVQQLLKPD